MDLPSCKKIIGPNDPCPSDNIYEKPKSLPYSIHDLPCLVGCRVVLKDDTMLESVIESYDLPSKKLKLNGGLMVSASDIFYKYYRCTGEEGDPTSFTVDSTKRLMGVIQGEMGYYVTFRDMDYSPCDVDYLEKLVGTTIVEQSTGIFFRIDAYHEEESTGTIKVDLSGIKCTCVCVDDLLEDFYTLEEGSPVGMPRNAGRYLSPVSTGSIYLSKLNLGKEAPTTNISDEVSNR